MSGFIHIDVLLEDSKLPEDALKIIEKVRPGWNVASIHFKIFTEGLSNKIIGVYCQNDIEHMVVVKVFGSNSQAFIDRKLELRNVKLLSSRGFTPKLLATFQNGYSYNYAHGEVVTTQTVRDPIIYPKIAIMLAKIHKLDDGYERSKVPGIWKMCTLIMNCIPAKSNNDLAFLKRFPGGVEYLKAELFELQTALEHVTSPIVLCHNDLLMSNIIYNGKSVCFIDYEYASYNWQAFDIANHFAEFAGVTDYDPSLYPNEEFQKDWIRYYLETYIGDNADVTHENIQSLYADVQQLFPLCHFVWSVWCIVQYFTSDIDFDYMGYGVLRFEQYLRYKNNVYDWRPKLNNCH